MLECINGSITLGEVVEEINGISGNVITGLVTKTVASESSANPENFDFQSLHEALRWLETIAQAGGTLTFLLDDGMHILGGEGEFNEDYWVYYYIDSKSFKFQSASGDKSLCTITISDYDDGNNWGIIMEADNSLFGLSNVTFNQTSGGYPYSKTMTIGYFLNSALVYYNSSIKNFNRGLLGTNSTLVEAFREMEVDNCTSAIEVGSPGASISYPVITNCDTGVVCTDGCSIVLENPTFTNNTEDANIPLNEIQYDGSYISDGTGPLSFKA